MHALKSVILALVLVTSPVNSLVFAGDKDPLFVNLTADELYRALMALTFSKHQLKLQHPVTIFLNNKAVLIASKANAEVFKEQQALLVELLDGGATVLICPMCMKHYSVADADLLPGIKVGNPEITGGALFRENTKTLSW